MRTAFIWAEYPSAARALVAATALRRAGPYQLDCYSPFAIPGLDAVLGSPRPRLLPALTFLGAVAGGCLAFLVMWWTARVSYPVDVGGRPLNSLPADIPIVFESSVLGAALAAFAGALILSRMPRLDHPLERLPGFERASDDRYLLGVRARSAEDVSKLVRILSAAGALHLHLPEDEEHAG